MVSVSAGHPSPSWKEQVHDGHQDGGRRAGPPQLRLRSAAAKLSDADGAGMSLGANNDHLDGVLQTVCATDGARDVEVRRFDLARVPRTPRTGTGWPAHVADLERDDTWPAFAATAVGSEVRGVFAFPLRAGSIGLGALALYRRVAASMVVSVQLGIPVGAALVLMRAHAFARGCSLAELAAQVVGRRLRLGALHGSSVLDGAPRCPYRVRRGVGNVGQEDRHGCNP